MIALGQRHRVCFSVLVWRRLSRPVDNNSKSPNGANNSAINSQGGTERLHFIDDYIIYRTVRYHILNPSRVMMQPLRERLLLT